MSAKHPIKVSRLKPWLWFMLIWILSVGALGLVAWVIRWMIRV